MQNLYLEKSCNAFFSDVESESWLLLGLRGVLASKLYKKSAGGLWVGGNFVANGEWFTFDPNILNVLAHKNAERVQIHISEVRNIRCESAFFTDIVVIEYARGEFKFRCYGARDVVNTLVSYLQHYQSFNNLYPTR